MHGALKGSGFVRERHDPFRDHFYSKKQENSLLEIAGHRQADALEGKCVEKPL